MTELLAQQPVPIGTPITGIGTIGLQDNPGGAVAVLAQVLSSTIGLLTIIAVIYFIFVIITGAISIISSGGDKGSLEMGQRKITMGIVGVIIAIAAMFIMDLLANILGIPSILDIGAMIGEISP
jgi:hypothetical protein